MLKTRGKIAKEALPAPELVSTAEVAKPQQTAAAAAAAAATASTVKTIKTVKTAKEVKAAKAAKTAKTAKPAKTAPAAADAAAAVRSDREAFHPELVTRKKTRRFHFALVFVGLLLIVIGVAVAGLFDRIEGGNIAVDDLTALSVTLNINSQPRQVATNCTTVGELLSEQNIRLTADDYLDLELNQKLTEGMVIWLRLAIDVDVQVGDQTYTVHSQPLTVAEALEKAGVKLGVNDRVDKPQLAYLYNDCTINVSRIEIREETVDEEIEFGTTTRDVSYLPSGSSAVLSAGQPGIRRALYKVTYDNGKEIGRELISSEVVSEPVDEVQGIGTGSSSASGGVTEATDGSELIYTQVLNVQATAYSWTGEQTATGTWPVQGRTIAVDPNVIPLGTKVYVPGYGYAVAEDTGGAIKGNIIDLYLDSESDCEEWGRRNITIYILPD